MLQHKTQLYKGEAGKSTLGGPFFYQLATLQAFETLKTVKMRVMDPKLGRVPKVRGRK